MSIPDLGQSASPKMDDSPYYDAEIPSSAVRDRGPSRSRLKRQSYLGKGVNTIIIFLGSH